MQDEAAPQRTSRPDHYFEEAFSFVVQLRQGLRSPRRPPRSTDDVYGPKIKSHNNDYKKDIFESSLV
jgi:hypothetical protein